MKEELKKRLEEIQKIATKEDYEEISGLIKNYFVALESGDKTKMSDASKSAFNLEKRYIPQINRGFSKSYPCQNLIMTVGFQKEPVILSILCMKPEKVALLHTHGSFSTAQDVKNDSDIKKILLPESIELFCINEVDAAQNYHIIRDEVLSWIDSKSSISVDPTAGRKVMVASVALVAYFYRFSMIYVHTEENKGIAVPFMETMRFIKNPFDFFGDIELKLIEESFNSHSYDTSVRIAESLLTTIRDPASSKKVELIKGLAEIYRDWDAFLHSAVPQREPLLSKRLEDICQDFHRFGFEKLLSENVSSNLSFLQKLEEGWVNKKNIVDEYRLVDIFVGALRRGSIGQGKYDDAVARLYRCLEMCTSLKLGRLGIKDTSKPDYDKFGKSSSLSKEELEKKYIEEKNYAHKGAGCDGLPARLALDDQMALLRVAGDKIGSIYLGMIQEKEGEDESLMDKRNRSILAHGTVPITEDDWKKFRDKTEVIIKQCIGNDTFNKLKSLAMPGKMKLN